MGSPTPLIKKICFEKTGLFDETLPSCQDWDMWLRISEYYEVDFVPDILAKHYFHDNQLTAKIDLKIQGREMMINKHQDILANYPLILSGHFSGLGNFYCINGNWKEGCKYFLKAIKLDPLQSIKVPLRDGLGIVKSKLKYGLKQWLSW